MKKMLFIWLWLAIAWPAGARRIPERVQMMVTVSTGLPISVPKRVPLSGQVQVDYQIAPCFQAGMGTGISVYEKCLLPLYAHLRLNLFRRPAYIPFVEVNGGYAFALSRQAGGGLYLSPAIGLEWPSGRRAKLLVGFGYVLQKFHRVKLYEGALLSSSYEEPLRHQALVFKVGVAF